MKISRLPIIISGGDIGGITFANALKKCKIPFLIIEKSLLFSEVGGGIGLWGPALKALRAIDVEEMLLPKGRVMKCAGYRNYDQIDNGKWLVQPSPNFTRHTSCLTIKRHEFLSLRPI